MDFHFVSETPVLASSLHTYVVFSSSSDFSTEENPKREDYFGITNLVEHPAQLNPPGTV
jgi:hypothetical protein